MAWALTSLACWNSACPFVQVRWGSFGASEFEVVRQPIVYAAWFAPLALAGANWRTMAADRRVWLVLGSALAFAALSMISHIGLLRWMFRMLPYYQIALIVAAALALTKADEEGKIWRFDHLALVIAAEVWLAFSQTTSLAVIYLGLACAFGALAWLSTRFGTCRDRRWTAMALAASVGVFALTVWNLAKDGYPTYPRAWKPPATARAEITQDTQGPERFWLIHRLGDSDPGAQFWSTYGVEKTVLYRLGASVGGYSPMLSPTFASLQCGRFPVDRCDDAIAYALAPVPPTGQSLLDLMGVGEVVVQRPADAAAFDTRAGGGWTKAQGPAGERRFVRPSREGEVTWASPGASGATRNAGVTRISIEARNDAPTSGTLVVARAWYPTWKATLGGTPLRAGAFDGTLIGVDLPPRSRGEVVLSFWPAGLTPGLILAVLGALTAAMGALIPTRVEATADWLEGVVFRRRPNTRSG